MLSTANWGKFNWTVALYKSELYLENNQSKAFSAEHKLSSAMLHKGGVTKRGTNKLQIYFIMLAQITRKYIVS